MRDVIFSDIVKIKLRDLKIYLLDLMDDDKVNELLDEIISKLDNLGKYPEMGRSLKVDYDIECDYYVFFLHKNYYFYKYDDSKVIILEMFNEREDFLLKMFGISSRTQESIDYWGE